MVVRRWITTIGVSIVRGEVRVVGAGLPQERGEHPDNRRETIA
jgi:hypothetical protein